MSMTQRIARGVALVAACALVGACAAAPSASTTAASGAVAPPSSGSLAASAGAGSPASSASATPGQSPASVPAGRIAFGRWDATVGGFVIFTVATNGSDLRMVLPGGHEIPRWSPNGDRLAVTGGNGVRVFETVVDADGSRPQILRLKDASLSLGCAAWSPDAARLACEGWDDAKPERNGIYTVRSSDGGDLTRVTTSPDGGHDIPGAYSPDGASIVFSRSRQPEVEPGEVWTVGVDGKVPHRIGAGQFGVGVSLSPDGTSILADANGVLRIIDVASGTETPIPIAGGAASGGRWSPDGLWIVFSLVPAGGDTAGISIARRDGTSVTAVTTPEAGHREEFADWSASP
jgi:Tol biopolymer transport system component